MVIETTENNTCVVWHHWNYGLLGIGLEIVLNVYSGKSCFWKGGHTFHYVFIYIYRCHTACGNMVLTPRSYEIEIIIMYSQYCLENTTFIVTYVATHVVCIYLSFGIAL